MTDARIPIVRTFMTHDMPDDAIWELFTGREQELEQVMEAVRRSLDATPGNLQHVVLYGARGFGKSFMTRRVQLDIQRTPGVGNVIRYLLLPEEQHNLQRSPHALLETLTALLDQGSDGDEAFAAAAFRWPREGEEARLWDTAAAALEAAIDRALPEGGLVIAAIENFDVLLATLFARDEDEQRLRLWLGRPGNRLMLLATATGTVDMDYERPLFLAFESVRLSPWSAQDCLDYFDRKRRRENRPPLDSRQVAKARAVADFIGGTPRLAQLLADVVDTGDALTVAETMSALADRLAEYYRRRIEDLSPLARGLLDALIRGGEPASQTALAERVGADGQSAIARVMSDLQTADIVRGRSAPDGREVLYSVTDRVFAHYYRLRQGSRTAQATPLATILDFLRGFYSRDEQRQEMLRYLEAGRPAEARVFGKLAVESSGEPMPRELLEAGHRLNWYMDAILPEDADGSHTDRSSGAQILAAIARAQELRVEGRTEEAVARLEDVRAAAVDPPSQLAAALEIALLRVKETPEGISASQDLLALVPLIDAVSAPELGSWARIWTSWALSNLEQLEQADAMLRRAAELALDASSSTLSAALILHAQILISMDRDAEAAQIASEAVAAAAAGGGKNAEFRALCVQVQALERAGRLEETLAQARIAAAHLSSAEEDDAGYFDRLTTALRRTDAEELELVARRGLELLDPVRDVASWWALRAVLWEALHKRGRFAEAADVASRSLELARTYASELDAARAFASRAMSRVEVGEHAAALADTEAGEEIVRRIGGDRLLTALLRLRLLAAVGAPAPDIVDHYRRMFEHWDAMTRRVDALAPTSDIGLLFVAVARVGQWEALDALLLEERDRFAGGDTPLYIFESDGAAFARVAADLGRAKTYDAASQLLPRLAAFMASLPPAIRDRSWLTDFIAGFAAKCRDPGVLRDLATLMTPALHPLGESAAELLGLLATVDEAPEPERVLARIDPDTATLVRRLRALPDPVVAPRRSRSRNRRQPG